MGVNGLTPFLRKIYPDVLRKVPERFHGLKGKKVVIDGTLITQRFYFVQDKHPYQHILSWVKFVGELQENHVSAVCIFDGKERNHAKARETQRRREARELASLRASIEHDRFARLNQAQKTLRQFNKLCNVDRQTVSSLLTSDASFGDADSNTLLQNPTLLCDREDEAMPTVLPPVLPQQPTPDLMETDLKSFPSAKEVATELKHLFLGFKANVAKLVTISIDLPQTLSSDISAPPEEEERVEKVMSKSQYELMVNESKFWKECVTTLTSDVPPTVIPSEESSILTSAHTHLNSLVDRSSVMASMYERRSNAPTQETYREARWMLEALGIPCFEVSGAYEAEALASSMVLSGLADYVVSEDTDVLVYEAPLIRNTTTRDPFFTVSGADVREALGLTRDEYIDFAILLGTDFSQRITNVGPVRALSFIKEHGCIENVVDSIANNPKYSLKLPKSAYLAQVDIARLLFKTLPSAPPITSFRPLERNDEKVDTILQKYGILQRDTCHDRCDMHHKDALIGNYFNDSPIAA